MSFEKPLYDLIAINCGNINNLIKYFEYSEKLGQVGIGHLDQIEDISIMPVPFSAGFLRSSFHSTRPRNFHFSDYTYQTNLRNFLTKDFSA